MAFPHPQSRKDHYRKEDIPSWGSIVWKFFKRTINIAEYRNGKDDVNPAKNSLGRLTARLKAAPLQTIFRLRRLGGRFSIELLGVLGVQSLPAELHGLRTNDASDRSSAEQVIQNIETNVPPGSTHCDKAVTDVGPQLAGNDKDLTIK